MTENVKILTLDIETSPHIASVWGLWDQRVSLNQLRECTTVICWAAKWHGQKKVEFMSDHHDDHEAQITWIWDLLDKADIVVGWNHKAFDLKHLNREFLLLGLNPPSSYTVVDLMLETRKNFKFASNKLDHVSQQLDIGQKLHHTGMDLWNGCVIRDDPKSWAVMKKYNVQDVVLTEKVFDVLRPWLKLPNIALIMGLHGMVCTSCGSEKIHKMGFLYTRTGRYQRYRCMDCGKSSADPKRSATTQLRPA